MAKELSLKLLVIRFGAMGDLLHTAPSLEQCLLQYPEAEIHYLSSPLYEPLLGAFGTIERIFTYSKASGLSGLMSLSQALAKEHYTHLINLHPSLKTWILTSLIRFQQFWSMPAVGLYRKQKFSKRGEALRQLPRFHAVEDFYQPFRHVLRLSECTAQELIPVLPKLAASRQPEAFRVGLVPGVGGKRANRAWPLAHYQALIDRLLAVYPALQVVVLGGPEECELGTALSATRPQVSNQCGQLSLLQTAETMSGCQLVVSGDTGPLHLAAAVGVPVLSLFGPTDIRRTGAVSDHVQSQLMTPPEPLTCWPCELPRCPLAEPLHLACMDGLSVEAVVTACQAILDGCRP